MLPFCVSEITGEKIDGDEIHYCIVISDLISK